VNTPRHEQDSQPGGRILVIRGGAIGDFILTLPAIAALRRQFPAVHLEVLGYPHIVQLALAGGLVDRVEPIEARGLAGFFARHGPLDESLGDYFSEFDVIVSYLFDPDEIFRGNVARCSPAQFIQGPHRPDESAGVSASQVYLKPLERLAIFGADPVPRLSIQGRQEESGMIALHPGSGSAQKNWPEARWSELLQNLIERTDRELLLVGGEAEGERLQRLAATLPPARIRVAQSLPLAELAKLLERCGGFLGHDSGISHLASALGLPGVVLWGHTVEAVWRPTGERVRILRAPGGLGALTTDLVLEHLLQSLQPD
jgi:heptosyltransferase-2